MLLLTRTYCVNDLWIVIESKILKWKDTERDQDRLRFALVIGGDKVDYGRDQTPLFLSLI